MSDEQCIHHWVIDEFDVGRCKKPGCYAVKDFGALMRKDKNVAEILHLVREHGKRGKRRKQAIKF